MTLAAQTLGVVGVTFVVLAGTGCRTEQTLVEPDPHLERMLVQQKRLAYDSDPAMPHGMAMQPPPEGAVPANAAPTSPETTGVDGDHWAARIPVPVDRAMIERGRARFDVFCAACHGVLGDGVSVVADKMALRKPPNLHDPRIVGYAPGRLFATVRAGYGLMPSYAVQLSVEDTWAVVAYVQALQLARGARVAQLPADIRTRLAKEAP